MSGGAFNYQQDRISDIANEIERLLFPTPPQSYSIETIGVDEIEKFLLPTVPQVQSYSPETIAAFEAGLKALRTAYIYAQRIDWLLCGDDGEASFHKKLKANFADLEKRAARTGD